MKSSLLYLLLLFVSVFHAQKVNRFNKKGERVGKWITYTDASHTKKVSEVRYRRGEVKGTAYYYTMEGVLERREIKRRKKIKTTLYYPGTSVPFSRGNARIDDLPEKVHYYFYGRWTYYDPEGKPEKYVYYEKGQQKRIQYLGKKRKFNDSLNGMLIVLDQHFRTEHGNMIDSVNLAWWNPKLAESFRQRIYKADSVSFLKTESLLGQFGYPSKETCSEQAAIVPFFIISHAPLAMREKYVELFMAAAGTGQLQRSALAYYIDKIKVAKGEKQVYGTQFYYTKDKKFVDYPSIDPEKLKERRKAMGLE